MNSDRKIFRITIAALSVALCVFQFISAAYAPLQAIPQRSLYLLFVLPLGFLYEAAGCRKKPVTLLWTAAALLSAAASFYVLRNWLELQNRTTQLVPADYFFAIAMIVLLLVITWRTVSPCMSVIAAVFILYAFLGQELPGIFYFPKISLRRFVASVFCGTEGIFGTCLGAAATYVFMFIMFGEFLSKYGAGDYFIHLSEAAFGKVRGSSGKIAIIASALFGMISGSPTANAAATGCLTIPLMQKSGYSSEYSGGLAAAASAGGSITPPVMGTAAFVMAEIIGMSYSKICIAAILPAVLYFLSLFIMVDLHAAKLGLSHGSDISISAKETFKEGWHYMAAIVVLFVLLIVLELSPAKSSFFSIVTLLVCDAVKARIENKKVDFSRIYDVVIAASKSAVSIAAVTACAGIIIGCFNATGLNLRLSTMLIEIAGGSKLILLLLAAVGALILGMGLPVTPVYILMAVMIAPALTASGIPKLAAHMFVFYFGAMAPITPPVGTAFYVTAGIAKSAPMKTGFTAWYMALVAFLVPFVWVYEPAFLLIGTVPEIIWTVITCTIGTVALAFGLEGYMLCRVSLPLRVVLIAAAIMMVIPERISTVIGLAVILAVLAVQFTKSRMSARRA